MRVERSQLLYSATDLASHLGCRHLTYLEHERAHRRAEPPSWYDAQLEVLRERGVAHEAAYLEHLRLVEGRDVERFDAPSLDEAGVAPVFEAMRRGVGAVAQAPLIQGRWRGIADVLLRVDVSSELGDWSYIPADTKLAAETRGGTVLQLCLYADLLESLQGQMPSEMLVVKPGEYATPERLQTCDFLAYYRRVRAEFEATLDDPDELAFVYPEPVVQCDICRWWDRCDKRRREDDHLAFIAGISRMQREELAKRGLGTLTAFAESPAPLEPPPERGSVESYERAHAQARIQLASRGRERPLVENLPPAGPGLGLSQLPEPSPGDLFLDFEGDPFVDGGGLEYLVGWVVPEEGADRAYEAIWATDRGAEKAALERLIDTIFERWAQHPGLHVYHFGAYEPSALKRLMSRHATRADELDRLLRGGRFIDLHAVVRQSLRVGVETYGLKQLEAVHGSIRELELREASLHKHALERALELKDPGAIRPEEREAVEAYNRDDCVSTLHLRDWLEAVRAERIAAGEEIPRPEPGQGDPSEALSEAEQRIQTLMDRLAGDVAADPAERTREQQARWLLAHLLQWHRREDKASWWEFFRLAALPDEDLQEERHGLFGLEFVERVGGTAKAPVDRYRFPVQNHDVRSRQALHVDAETPIGAVEEVDLGACTIDVKKRVAAAESHPPAVFAHEQVPSKPIPQALEALAEWVAEHGIDAPGPFRAARDLLLAQPPRLSSPPAGPLALDNEGSLKAATRLALELENGVLPIQGPPGTGKTYTGARVICRLVEAGKTVGVTAVSHKVIRNLLDEVLAAARELGVEVQCFQKADAGDEELPVELTVKNKNEALDKALATGTAQVGAGTVWLWSRDAAINTIDYLVVDEAGQISLANAVAAAKAAKNVLLLGDPQQLEQPMQGVHPEGCDVSALEHVLQEHDTVPPERGLFLGETWRLHPNISEFTSELFYDARLNSHPNCGRQALSGSEHFDGAGLWLCSVPHEGNQTTSPEEVEYVAALVDQIVVPGSTFTDMKGVSRALTLQDVMILSPYNAHVAALSARLPGMNVGTVDKFQGQEAPVVIYSMATSSAEEAPRGLEFLLSLNRLNVATSRARCACLLVLSPHLLNLECRTPRQMRLANALCRYRELARA